MPTYGGTAIMIVQVSSLSQWDDTPVKYVLLKLACITRCRNVHCFSGKHNEIDGISREKHPNRWEGIVILLTKIVFLKLSFLMLIDCAPTCSEILKLDQRNFF